MLDSWGGERRGSADDGMAEQRGEGGNKHGVLGEIKTRVQNKLETMNSIN